MITLERRPFKEIVQIGAPGVTRPEAVRGKANSFEAPRTKRVFKELAYIGDDEEPLPGAFAVVNLTTVRVLNSDGSLRWTQNIIRHSDGDLQRAQGCCFGLNQDVWVGLDDIFNAGGAHPEYPFGHRNGYLFHYDRNGNFLEEFSVVWIRGLGTRFRCLRSNPSGVIVRSQIDDTPTMGEIRGVGPVDLDNPFGNYHSTLGIDVNGRVYGVADTVTTPYAFWKWDTDGTLMSTVSAAYTGEFDVSADGLSYWIGSAQATTVPFPGYQHTFRKIDAVTGSVLATQSEMAAGPITALRATPWGTRISSYGSDCDASEVQGHQLVAASAQVSLADPGDLTGLTCTYDGVEVVAGDPFEIIIAVATSID